MPEGDTIHRAARNLHVALAGRRVARFEAPSVRADPPLVGAAVRSVEARGKHCLVHFDDGRTLRTHMRMTGSWHLYRPGERWQKRPSAARVVLEAGEAADAWVAVCFAAPVVELLGRRDAARGAGTDHLGPDLCVVGADVDEAVRRMGTLVAPDTPLGVVLLDQRVACGVGNVYKSEVCFLGGVDPRSPVGAVGPELRRRLVETAGEQLRRNLTTRSRTTVPGGGLWVYGRAGLPCRRCAGTVRATRQGDDARSTYWCPRCQPGPEGAAGVRGEFAAPGSG